MTLGSTLRDCFSLLGSNKLHVIQRISKLEHHANELWKGPEFSNACLVNPNEHGFLGAIKIVLSFDLYLVQWYLPRNFIRPVSRSRVEIQFGDLSWADEGDVMESNRRLWRAASRSLGLPAAATLDSGPVGSTHRPSILAMRSILYFFKGVVLLRSKVWKWMWNRWWAIYYRLSVDSVLCAVKTKTCFFPHGTSSETNGPVRHKTVEQCTAAVY